MMTPNQFGSEENSDLKQLAQEAIALYRAGNLPETESICMSIIERYPHCSQAFYMLALVADQVKNFEVAIDFIEEAIGLNSTLPEYYHLAGQLYMKTKQLDRGIEYYKEAIQRSPSQFRTYISLCGIYRHLYKYDLAEQILLQALEHIESDHDPILKTIYLELAQILAGQNKYQQALEAYRNLLAQDPDHFFAFLSYQLLLPVMYQTQAEIHECRDRFTQGLQNVTDKIDLEDPEERRKFLQYAQGNVNFYLPYQGYSDRALQQKYGAFLHRAATLEYPHWSSLRRVLEPLDQLKKRKIRIGYLSETMYNQTISKLTIGWLAQHNLDQFEIYAYCINPLAVDSYTLRFEEYSDQFRFFYSHNITTGSIVEAIAKQVESDQLDVLVFLDISMRAIPTQVASFRLAPVQCGFWGHPTTTGIPTVDYFISSDLMESDHAQEYYTEKLVRLPGIGIYYAKPPLPPLDKSRVDFDLDDSKILYLSCQARYKYLPQFDHLFPDIALQLPTAQFAFLSYGSRSVDEQFCQRLERAFADRSLNWADFCQIVPRLNFGDYLNLNQLSDVFLDTPGWSGGNTTLEAIACNLPIVTYPLELMRSRHAYGILRMLGITETVAWSEAEYVQIAVRLGRDPGYRAALRQRIEAGHSRLYADRSCVEALESFYRFGVEQAVLKGGI